ncbi:hypothetical protein AK812_SmicGene47457, partial [Symbiodinium microadriaticum]
MFRSIEGDLKSYSNEAFLEPKWTLSGAPYEGGWCRPQTD